MNSDRVVTVSLRELRVDEENCILDLDTFRVLPIDVRSATTDRSFSSEVVFSHGSKSISILSLIQNFIKHHALPKPPLFLYFATIFLPSFKCVI